MAAAGLAAAPIVTDIIDRTAGATEKQLAAFSEDPVAYAGKWSLRIGIGCAAGALGCYIVANATERAQQQYLNDMDNVLGIAPEARPTPPKTQPPPAPAVPAYISQFNAVVSDLASPDHANAQNAYNQLQQALKDSIALQDTIYGQPASAGHWYANDQATQTPPGGAEGDINNLQIEIMRAMAFLTGAIEVPFDVGSATDAQRINAALAPYTFGPGNSTNWGAAQDSIGGKVTGENAKAYVNNLAGDLGLQKPYNLTNPGSSGPWGQVGVTFGGVLALVENAGATAQADVSNAVQGAEAAATTFVGDVSLIGKALFNLPRLTFDAAGYGISWGLNTVANDALAPMAIGAVIGIGFGLFARWVYPRLKPRLVLMANAKTASFWNRFDRAHQMRKKVKEVRELAATDASIETVNAELAAKVEPATVLATPPLIDAPAAGGALTKPTEGEGGEGSSPGVASSEPPPPAPEPVEPVPSEPEAPPPVPEAPPPPTPTSETEAHLGEPDTTEEIPEPPPTGKRAAEHAHAQFAAMEAPA